MPNPKTDNAGFSTSNADEKKVGVPDDKHGINKPYDSDLQTQIAAKGKKEKERTKHYRKDSL